MNKKIAVIVPAYNEELLIEKTINSIPNRVDKIFVINDASKDNTKQVVEDLMSNNDKVILVNLEKNSGVGSAIL